MNIKQLIIGFLIAIMLAITTISASAEPIAYHQGACTSSYNWAGHSNINYYSYNYYEYAGWGLRRYNYHQPYYYPYYRQNSRYEYWP